MKKNRLTLLFIILIIGLVTLAVSRLSEKTKTQPKAAGVGADLSLIAGTQSVNPGQQFVVDVVINTNDKTVSAVDFTITNTSQVKPISASATNLLPLVLQGPDLTNTTTHFVVGSNATSPFKGVNTIAKITYQAASGGSGKIDFGITKVAAIEDAESGANVLRNTSGTSVTVAGSPSSIPSSDKVDLSFSTPKTSLTPGEEFDVNLLMATNQQNVDAAELHVNFDSSKLSATSFLAGQLLPVILQQGVIGPSEASITLGRDHDGPFPQDGVLAKLRMKVKSDAAAGNTSLNYSATTRIAVAGNSQNALGITTPVSLQIAAISQCVADITGISGTKDGKTDIFDYAKMLEEFGKTGSSPADLDKDGDVDIFDYSILLGDFGCGTTTGGPTVTPGAQCTSDSNCPAIFCINPPCPQNKCIGGKCVLIQPTPPSNVTPTKTPTPRPTVIAPTNPPHPTSPPPQGQFPGGVYPNAPSGWIPVSYQGWSVPKSALGGMSTRDFVFGNHFNQFAHWHFEYNLPNTCGGKTAINTDTQVPVTLVRYNDNSPINMCRIQNQGSTYQQHSINLPSCQSGTGVDGEGRECVDKDKCIFTLRANDFKGSTELRLTPNSPNSPAAGDHRWYLSTNFQTKAGYRSSCQFFTRDENCGSYHRTIISNYDKLFASGEPIPTVRGIVPVELEFNGGCGSFSRSMVFADPNQHVGPHGQMTGSLIMDVSGDFKGTFNLDTTKLSVGIHKILFINAKGSDNLVGASGIALLFNVQR